MKREVVIVAPQNRDPGLGTLRVAELTHHYALTLQPHL